MLIATAIIAATLQIEIVIGMVHFQAEQVANDPRRWIIR